jgi:hypothetical protein
MKDNTSFNRLLLVLFLIIIAALLYLNYSLITNINFKNKELGNIQISLYASPAQSLKTYGYSDALILFNNNLNLKILNINNDAMSKGIVKIDAEYAGSVYSFSNILNDIKKAGNFYSIENIKICNTSADKQVITFTINFLNNK